MILFWLIMIPFGAGVLALLVGRVNPRWPRGLAVLAMAADLALALILWAQAPGGGRWIAELRWNWIPQLGVTFHLGADGLSVLMVVLSAFIGTVAVVFNGRDGQGQAGSGTRGADDAGGDAPGAVSGREGFYYFNVLWVLAGMMGVFLALDLFLFYFLWELMLVPMYFLIAVFGHERRGPAAAKFFIFTQLSGLLMLLAILGLYFAAGKHSFDYVDLLESGVAGPAAMWLMLGFFVAFAVKLGIVPFHSWLPDAYEQAPTAGSVLLAALMAKTGAYGLLRFVLPLFPAASAGFATAAMLLGVASIVYGAVLAFAQTDLKRLIAYSSVSHMGFVLLGVFAWNVMALQGVVVQMLAHAVTTGALFLLAGAVVRRTQTRDLRRMGGLAAVMPRTAGVMLLFALAAMGLPGLGNFVGEFLILAGTWRVSVPFAAVGVSAAVFSVIYVLRMIHGVSQGPVRESESCKMGKREKGGRGKEDFSGLTARPDDVADISAAQTAVCGVLIAAIFWIGLHPQPFLDMSKPVIEKIEIQNSPRMNPTRSDGRNQDNYYPSFSMRPASKRTDSSTDEHGWKNEYRTPNVKSRISNDCADGACFSSDFVIRCSMFDIRYSCICVHPCSSVVSLFSSHRSCARALCFRGGGGR